MKKILAMFLAMLMLFSIAPTAFAEGTEAAVAEPLPESAEQPAQETQENPVSNGDPGTKSVTEETTDKETYKYDEDGDEYTIEETINVTEYKNEESETEALLLEEKAKITVEGENATVDLGEGFISGDDLISQEDADSEHGKAQILTLDPEAGLYKAAIVGGNSECEHTWNSGEIVKAASCKECGVVEYTCTVEGCGAVMTVLIDKTEHTKAAEGVSAPCAENPYVSYVCSVCGEVFTEPYTGEKTAHTMVDGKCTACGYCESAQGTVMDCSGGSPAEAAEYAFSGDTLTVYKESGQTGIIPDYDAEISLDNNTVLSVPNTEATPWSSFASQVKNLVVKSGITRIGDWAFGLFKNLKNVFIESKTIEIGDYAFAGDENLENVNLTDKNAVVTYDNAKSTVSLEADGNIYTDVGATAFLGDENVSVNYSCVNPKADEQERTQEFAFTEIKHTDLHLNTREIKGYAPTEKEFGLTDGVYCDDCEKMIVPQYKIYPDGKAETGKYKITDFSKLKEVPESLKDTNYNTIEKLSELKDAFKNALSGLFRKKFNCEMPDNSYRIYDIELEKLNGNTAPDKHIVNIPYPIGGPESYDYMVVQLNEDGELEEIGFFLTNKGIQIEVETLRPIAVAWRAK